MLDRPADSCRVALREFIGSSFPEVSLRDDESIFEMGFVSSMFALELVQYIEGEFHFQVESEDLVLENFETIDAMVELIDRKAR